VAEGAETVEPANSGLAQGFTPRGLSGGGHAPGVSVELDGASPYGCARELRQLAPSGDSAPSSVGRLCTALGGSRSSPGWPEPSATRC